MIPKFTLISRPQHCRAVAAFLAALGCLTLAFWTIRPLSASEPDGEPSLLAFLNPNLVSEIEKSSPLALLPTSIKEVSEDSRPPGDLLLEPLLPAEATQDQPLFVERWTPPRLVGQSMFEGELQPANTPRVDDPVIDDKPKGPLRELLPWKDTSARLHVTFAAGGDPAGFLIDLGQEWSWTNRQHGYAGLTVMGMNSQVSHSFVGLNAGYRYQYPARISPFIGCGTLLGLATSVPGAELSEFDGPTNAASIIVTSIGTVISFFLNSHDDDHDDDCQDCDQDHDDGLRYDYDIYAGLRPEAGLHFHFNNGARVSLQLNYLLTTKSWNNRLGWVGITYSTRF